MTRRFWTITGAWILGIAAAALLIIEMLDDVGLGFRIPGLSVTGGEIALLGLLAGVPPLIAALIIRRRAESAIPRA